MKDKKFLSHNNKHEKIVDNNMNISPLPIGYISNGEENIPVMPIQPIIFRTANPEDNRAPEDLYSAPLNAAGQYNFDIAKNHFDDFVDSIGSIANHIHYNQISITRNMCIEYIMRNTFNNFCIMVDNVGPKFSSVIRFVPLKATVHQYLLGDKSETCIKIIRDILYSFFCGQVNHQTLFSKALEASDKDINTLNTITDIKTMQICEQLFANICYACEEAITNAYLNVFDSPNAKNMYDNAIRVFNIKDVDPTTPMYISGLIKRLILNNINLMMSSTILPSVKELFEGLRMNMYFVFGSIDNTYYNNMREKKINEVNQCNPDCSCRDESCPPFYNTIEF